MCIAVKEEEEKNPIVQQPETSKQPLMCLL